MHRSYKSMVIVLVVSSWYLHLHKSPRAKTTAGCVDFVEVSFCHNFQMQNGSSLPLFSFSRRNQLKNEGICNDRPRRLFAGVTFSTVRAINCFLHLITIFWWKFELPQLPTFWGKPLFSQITRDDKKSSTVAQMSHRTKSSCNRCDKKRLAGMHCDCTQYNAFGISGLVRLVTGRTRSLNLPYVNITIRTY